MYHKKKRKSIFMLLTLSFLWPAALYIMYIFPSKLDATLKDLINSAVPIRLAPCVMMPVSRIFFCRSIWKTTEHQEYSSINSKKKTTDCLSDIATNLKPRVLVMWIWTPSIHETLVVEAGQLRSPALQSQNAKVHRGGRDLGLNNSPFLHS